jgi:hypothetical protein
MVLIPRYLRLPKDWTIRFVDRQADGTAFFYAMDVPLAEMVGFRTGHDDPDGISRDRPAGADDTIEKAGLAGRPDEKGVINPAFVQAPPRRSEFF